MIDCVCVCVCVHVCIILCVCSDVPGVVTTDGILEANQGQEHGAARVYGKVLHVARS